ncbi:MAG TPA: hypothetical protein PK175_06220 [Syntrophales bacterium]|jgi:hypothetical protein|nr:hypothetical protein [Syntrophales bacterium]HOU77880.1 hypothetical protein [Syntrophales bacterium]HPC31739.1 hypothetical protein [Syntrophales bacterium]HQG34446.1 hypothetical protein [Syntrophales bacterium]HQI34574.1 hypothetical protein [Syntrophales bacterium]
MVEKIDNKKGGKEIISDPEGRDSVEILNPVQKSSPFISFRYSCKEVSSHGGKTRIRSTEQSFEDGNFKSEEFEGYLPGNFYLTMVGQMQKMFFSQLSIFLKPFSMFLPFDGSRDKDR